MFLCIHLFFNFAVIIIVCPATFFFTEQYSDFAKEKNFCSPATGKTVFQTGRAIVGINAYYVCSVHHVLLYEYKEQKEQSLAKQMYTIFFLLFPVEVSTIPGHFRKQLVMLETVHFTGYHLEGRALPLKRAVL